MPPKQKQLSKKSSQKTKRAKIESPSDSNIEKITIVQSNVQAANNVEAKIVTLENFTNNPGLQHLAEEIFWNLNVDALEMCEQINQFSRHILENPLFWLEKFIRGGLSKKNQEDWMKAVQLVKNTDKEKHLTSYLKWTLKNKGVSDLSCYTTPIVQDDFQRKVYDAAQLGHTEIVKILAPLTDNPNAPNQYGWTPIHAAAGAGRGYTEIVKILVPLTDNPNATNQYGITPSSVAENAEILEILESV